MSKLAVFSSWAGVVTAVLLILQRLVSGHEPGWLAVAAAAFGVLSAGDLRRHYRRQTLVKERLEP